MTTSPPTPPPKPSSPSTYSASPPIPPPKPSSPQAERTVPSPNRGSKNFSSSPPDPSFRPPPLNHTHYSSSSYDTRTIGNSKPDGPARASTTGSPGSQGFQPGNQTSSSTSPSPTSARADLSPGLLGAFRLKGVGAEMREAPEQGARPNSRGPRGGSGENLRRSLSGDGDYTGPRGLDSPLSSGSDNTASTPWNRLSRADSDLSQISRTSDISDLSNDSSLNNLDTFVTPNEVFRAREDPFDDVPDTADGYEHNGLTDQTPMHERSDPMAGSYGGIAPLGMGNAMAEGGPSTQAAKEAREVARLRETSLNDTITGSDRPEDSLTETERGQRTQEDEEYEEDLNDDLEGDDLVSTIHPPVFNRSFSSPLPNRVGHLRHPGSIRGKSGLRNASMNAADVPPMSAVPSIDSLHSLPTFVSRAPTPTALETVSLELADSLQSAIQTLLHLSPPHLLDNAKEQYSACTVQLPTTSLSAILTAMRKLNYLSANLQAFCNDDAAGQTSNSERGPSSPIDQGHVESPVSQTGSSAGYDSAPPDANGTSAPAQVLPDHGIKTAEDFDIGEMLQSTADLLGGQAAQAGVDLVLFHGDVGLKHISVGGDGEGLGYALSHVIRQILLVCRHGDALELGLLVAPQPPSLMCKVNHLMTPGEIDESRKHPEHAFSEEASGWALPGEADHGQTGGSDSGPLLLTFQIVHNEVDEEVDAHNSTVETPRAEKAEPMMLPQRKTPDFDGLICKRILRHVNATLQIVGIDSTPCLGGAVGSTRKAYEISVLLARGEPISEPAILTSEEQAARQPYPSVQLAREPTLQELSDFTEKLRGKNVELHANTKSVFARHINSYLSAWGMDVSHFPVEDEASRDQTDAGSFDQADHRNAGRNSMDYGSSSPSDRFVIIDDDVSVLRTQLLRVRSELPVLQLRPKNHKRPTMGGRTRSSPQIRAIQESISIPMPNMTVRPTIMIHFTSLANYNHVRDVVANILATTPPTSYPPPPDVLVIPKPIGPRRFLTTLHTAINRPLIDPYFAPIANSPRSPGGGYFPGVIARTPSAMDIMQRKDSYVGGGSINAPLADVGGYLGAGQGTEANASPALSVTSNTSGGSRQLKTPMGDVLATPAGEYFNEAASKLGAAAASGVMVQSPDGRPYGMYFEPPVRDNNRRSTPLGKGEPRRRASLRNSAAPGADARLKAPAASASPTQRRLSGMSAVSAGDPERKSALQSVLDEEESAESSTAQTPAPMTRAGSLRRRATGLPSTQGPFSPSQRSDRSPPTISTGSDGTSPRTTAHDQRSPESQTLDTSPITPLDNLSPVEPIRPSKKAAAIESRRLAQTEAAEAAALVEAQKVKVAPVTTKKAATAKGGLIAPPINVLIVEDNIINQNILSMFLRKKKIKHQAANNGQEAVDKWRTGTFHLILMDIQLPVMDGIEATKEIRRMEKSSNIGIFPSTPSQEFVRTLSPANEEPPSTPFRSSVIIVALTASSYQTDRVNALAAGCNDFLTKPVSLPWLEAKIIEWGCMQALIDFEGWRKWRTSDNKDNKSLAESKRNFLATSEAKAKMVAKGLNINRGNRLSRPTVPVESSDPPAPPAPTPSTGLETPGPGISISVTQATPGAIDNQSDPVHNNLPVVPEDPVVPGDTGVTGLDVLTDGLQAAKADVDVTGGRQQAPARPEGDALDEGTQAQASASHDGSKVTTPVAPIRTPTPPPSSERAKTSAPRPMSPDIIGSAGDADAGPLPDSAPSSQATPADDIVRQSTTKPVIVNDTEATGTEGEPPATRRMTSTDKPLPPLPE